MTEKDFRLHDVTPVIGELYVTGFGGSLEIISECSDDDFQPVVKFFVGKTREGSIVAIDEDGKAFFANEGDDLGEYYPSKTRLVEFDLKTRIKSVYQGRWIDPHEDDDIGRTALYSSCKAAEEALKAEVPPHANRRTVEAIPVFDTSDQAEVLRVGDLLTKLQRTLSPTEWEQLKSRLK